MDSKAHTDIPLAVVGCDFRTASTAWREKLVIDPESRKELFASLQSIDPEVGLAVLETCNRVEWIVSSPQPGWIANLLAARMQDRWAKAFPDTVDQPRLFAYENGKAAKHILRLVTGMESLAVGEAQIAGQFQNALAVAQKDGTSSPILNGLGTVAGRIAKTANRIGFRSNSNRGIHGLVLSYISSYFPQNTKDLNVLVLGMGEIGRKTASLIETYLECNVTPINRTIGEKHAGLWRPISDLPQLSATADVLVVATGARKAIVSSDLLTLDNRENNLLVMDIGVPRQVERDIIEHSAVKYRCVDDLAKMFRDDSIKPLADSMEAEIRTEVGRFRRFCLERDMVGLLEATHQRRKDLVWQQIPELVQEKLGHLPDDQRKQVQLVMQQVVRDYSNDIFKSIHDVLSQYWSDK